MDEQYTDGYECEGCGRLYGPQGDFPQPGMTMPPGYNSAGLPTVLCPICTIPTIASDMLVTPIGNEQVFPTRLHVVKQIIHWRDRIQDLSEQVRKAVIYLEDRDG